ncbi:immunoglobulin-like domain-containing protein, partial [Catenovulum maritimum]
ADLDGVSEISARINDVSGGNYENLIIDETPAVTEIAQAVTLLAATDSLTEAGGTIVYTAELSAVPESDVTITLSNGETITILAGETSASVNVEFANSDDVYLDESTISANITDATGGGFVSLGFNDAPAVTRITDTVDTTDLRLSATDSLTEAGGTITYTATLTNAADTDVTITLANEQTITIAAGQTQGSIEFNVAADEDAIVDAGSITNSIASATGGNFENLVVEQTTVSTSILPIALPTIVIADNNGVEIGDITVEESGLLTDENTTEIETGSVTFNAEAGIENIVIAGTSVSIDDLLSLSETPIQAIQTENGSLQITGYDSGVLSYEFTLESPVQHELESDQYTEEVDIKLTDSFGREVTDRLLINIEDDQPELTIIQPEILEFDSQPYNIVIVLDVSGSMDNSFGTDSRLEAAIYGVEQMLSEYSALGDIQVKVVSFSDNASENTWGTSDSAINILNSLSASGATDFDDPLTAIVDGYNPPLDAPTKLYFISDGNPSGNDEGQSNQAAINAYQQTWANFVEENSIDVQVVGVTNNPSYQYLNMIGAPTEEIKDVDGNYLPAENVVSVNAAIDLVKALVSSVEVSSSGNINTNIGVLDFGADGPGKITSVEFDGNVYRYDDENVIDDEITIYSSAGSEILFNFTTGEYEYKISIDAQSNANESSGIWFKDSVDDYSEQWRLAENFSINIEDSDGDLATGALNLVTKFPATSFDIAPIAKDDFASINEVDGLFSKDIDANTVTGNVLDNDSLSNLIVAPVISAGFGEQVSSSNVGQEIKGEYGSLFLQSDGSYTYILNNSLQAVNSLDYTQTLNEIFSYVIENENGTTSTAKLELTINGTTDSQPEVNRNVFYGFDGDDNISVMRAFSYFSVLQAGAYEDLGDLDGINGYHTYSEEELTAAGYKYFLGLDKTQSTGLAEYDISTGGIFIGGLGADKITGGLGDDVIIGGANSHGSSGLVAGSFNGDYLKGGAGSDTFLWMAGDDVDLGFANSDYTPDVATDYIGDFEKTERDQAGDITKEGDIIDLADLLEDESIDDLDRYLNFEVVDGDTVISVSKDGDFHENNGDKGKADIKIVVENTDLTVDTTGSDADVIRKLLEDNQLHTD